MHDISTSYRGFPWHAIKTEPSFYRIEEHSETDTVTSIQDSIFRRIRQKLRATGIEFQGKVEYSNVNPDNKACNPVARLVMETSQLTPAQIYTVVNASRRVINPRPGLLVIENDGVPTDIGTYKDSRAL